MRLRRRLGRRRPRWGNGELLHLRRQSFPGALVNPITKPLRRHRLQSGLTFLANTRTNPTHRKYLWAASVVKLGNSLVPQAASVVKLGDSMGKLNGVVGKPNSRQDCLPTLKGCEQPKCSYSENSSKGDTPSGQHQKDNTDGWQWEAQHRVFTGRLCH